MSSVIRPKRFLRKGNHRQSISSSVVTNGTLIDEKNSCLKSRRPLHDLTDKNKTTFCKFSDQHGQDVYKLLFNPYVTNGISHPYHLD